MDNPEQKRDKSCPYCAETIPLAAKICPRCRQWLALRSFRNPIFAILFVMLPMCLSLIFMGAWALKLMQKTFNPPPYFSDFRGAIEILDAKMKWIQTAEGSRLFITGMITNRSAMAWRRPEFECRFFNSKTQMIDAATASSYLTILPGSDSAFRAYIVPALSSNEYDSFKISLSSAYNARTY